jgi:hypothetical protein
MRNFTLEATGQLGKDDILTERGRRDPQQKRREEFCRHHSAILPLRSLCPMLAQNFRHSFIATGHSFIQRRLAAFFLCVHVRTFV